MISIPIEATKWFSDVVRVKGKSALGTNGLMSK